MLQKILVVDDDDESREILAALLEEKYEIIHARDGREAIGILAIQMGTIEAVLLDLVMPNLDGFGFLKEIRKKKWKASFPIIVVSGNDDVENRELCKKSGIEYFITKPYTAKEAKKIIGEAIANNKAKG
ncbi:MAG: response regulator [Lachnospiraceae bacterium]|nr:response regulator [Lachnospiraceae bacterium]